MRTLIYRLSFAFLLLCFMCTVTISLRLKSKAISFDPLKRIDDVTGTARGRQLAAVKWRQKSKRITEDNRVRKQKRGGDAVELEMKFCKPYPSILPVPEPAVLGSFYLPSFVELYRCAGGCSMPQEIGYCAVTDKKNITVRVNLGQNPKQHHTVVMSNHTGCQCACLPKKCTSRQRFNTDICECECIHGDQSDCNKNENKQWDRHLCECVCSIESACKFAYKWNKESCLCELDEDPTGSVVGRL
ncbi:hypothetical protein OS493_018358 [Desmophyllum pertusum]|uniref:Platelet-derived growth factor (PDGF) family profile domain-containing protein n=1 Tax=Desmophyllum pertusum TaxID=174260 RepID=A0A9W9YDS0_9CNID|nr:hypothetical protein OS493_018358 [Desmophyllum pertusum]